MADREPSRLLLVGEQQPGPATKHQRPRTTSSTLLLLDQSLRTPDDRKSRAAIITGEIARNEEGWDDRMMRIAVVGIMMHMMRASLRRDNADKERR